MIAAGNRSLKVKLILPALDIHLRSWLAGY